MKNFVLIGLFLLPQFLWAQKAVTGFSPAHPKVGEELIVWYDPTHPKAMLSSNEMIYVAVSFLKDSTFDTERQMLRTTQVGDRFLVNIYVPEDCMTINLYFYTASTNSFDWAGQEIDLFNINGLKIKDKYSGLPYRNKWFPYPFKFGEDTARIKIWAEMTEVEKLRDQDPLGVGYSMAYGYLLTSEEKRSREEILQMLKHYPSHELTYQALESYLYMVYAGKIDNPEGVAEMDSFQLDMVTKNPEKQLARSFLKSRNSEKLPTPLVERICRYWISEEPDDAQAYLRLASRYHDEGINPREIISLSEKGIELLLEAKNRIYLDLKGSMTRSFLSHFSLMKAVANMKLSRYSDALQSAIQASAFNPNGNAKLIEGKIWEILENYSEAETALVEAIKLGDGEAESELKLVFAKRKHPELEFKKYLEGMLGKTEDPSQDSKSRSTTVNSKPKTPSAPDFHATTIDGKEINLSDLKGKVVVLNFWNLGCGPCRAEMPELNKLVAKYKDKEVAFVAISNDAKNRVVEFLKMKEFDYQQVTDANSVFKTYEVRSLPTHVIIDRNGSVYHRIIGGGGQIAEVLDNILKVLL